MRMGKNMRRRKEEEEEPSELEDGAIVRDSVLNGNRTHCIRHQQYVARCIPTTHT